VAVAGVGGSGAVGGKLLEALDGDGAEVAGEGRVLRQHNGALGHEAVNQRLLAAVHGAPPQKPLNGNPRTQIDGRQESAREFTQGEELYKNREYEFDRISQVGGERSRVRGG